MLIPRTTEEFDTTNAIDGIAEFMDVEVKHVAAHSEVCGNELGHSLAKEGEGKAIPIRVQMEDFIQCRQNGTEKPSSPGAASKSGRVCE